MININPSKNFTKEWDRLRRGAKTSYKEMIEDEYDVFVDCKINKKPLPDRFEDHGLNNNRRFKDCRDAHLAGDTVVIYQESEDEVKLLHVGNHNNLLENIKIAGVFS